MIDGIKIKNLKVMCDGRGRLMEMLRCDDEIFSNFGQAYMTSTFPGVVKGWHYHEAQTDNIVCVSGMIKLVVCDKRKEVDTRNRPGDGIQFPGNLTLNLMAAVCASEPCVRSRKAAQRGSACKLRKVGR